MVMNEWGCLGFLVTCVFLVIGIIIANFFPEPNRFSIVVIFTIIGFIPGIIIALFGQKMYRNLKQKPLKGDEKYVICPECNIQVERATGVCPKCGKNLLYSSKIKAE